MELVLTGPKSAQEVWEN